MVQIILYFAAIVFTIISFLKDKEKTIRALKKGWTSFENILPTILAVMAVIGITLSIVDEKLIASLIGPGSGMVGVLLSIGIGSITMMGGFIAFPLGATLLLRGAGVSQVAAFISSLMMVGFLTIPLEEKYWGRKTTILRNVFGLVISFIVGIVMGWVYK
ncbi:permease [Clostridium paraputrificum]|uniref:permease n=1 Tax=Clostridium paraputrificum TaxID=29363 RepID=UPI003D3383DB